MAAAAGILNPLTAALLIAIMTTVTSPFAARAKREWTNTTLVHHSCTRHTSRNSRYLKNVLVAMDNMAERTSTQHHYDYHVSSPTWPVVYGHANCSRSLAPKSCDRCLREAEKAMAKVCKLRVGGIVQLSDCRVRYNNAVFSDY